MRNILYICTKSQYDWDTFIPHQESLTSELNIAVLLLQSGMGLRDIPTSQVSLLKTEGTEQEEFCAYETITYQEFLEKIFLADLPLLI